MAAYATGGSKSFEVTEETRSVLLRKDLSWYTIVPANSVFPLIVVVVIDVVVVVVAVEKVQFITIFLYTLY